MTTLATETWTGADGAAWPAQWTTRGGTLTIQGNAGRLAPSAVGYTYSRADLTGMPLADNIEVSGTLVGTFDAVEQYIEVHVNSDLGTTSSNWEATNSFVLLFTYDPVAASGNIKLQQSIAGTTTTISAAPNKTLVGTGRVGFRVRRIGTDLRARVWDASGAEPSSWDVTATVTPMSGRVGLLAANGAASVSRAFDFDSLIVTDGAVGGLVYASFIRANSGLSQGSFADHELAYFRTASILSTGSLADCKLAYFRAQTGLSKGSLADAERAWLALKPGYVATLSREDLYAAIAF
jgi:hypothetical protein